MVPKKSKILIIQLIILFCPAAGMAEIIHVDKAVEAETFQFVNSKPVGNIVARECKKCPELRLTTNVHTQAIRNGHTVTMSEVPMFSSDYITVIYDPKTMVAKKILW